MHPMCRFHTFTNYCITLFQCWAPPKQSTQMNIRSSHTFTVPFGMYPSFRGIILLSRASLLGCHRMYHSLIARFPFWFTSHEQMYHPRSRAFQLPNSLGLWVRLVSLHKQMGVSVVHCNAGDGGWVLTYITS